MREILYRAKRVDSGEWVEGLLWKKKYNTSKLFMSYFPDKDDNEAVALIAPETVGQYTGLTDKNGKKIFEGDIVEFYFFDKTKRNGELVEVKNTRTMVIYWSGQSFFMNELFRNYRLDEENNIVTEIIYKYRNYRKQGVYQTNKYYFVEIIGNIHDNPELLQEDAR